MRKSILADGTAASIGSLAYGLCQWYVAITIGRKFGSEQLGYYSLALSIVAPIFTFAMLGLRPMQVSEKNAEIEFNVYFLARLVCMGAAFLFSLVSISVFHLGGIVSVFLVMLAILKTSEGVSDVIYGSLQRKMRFFTIFRSQIYKSCSCLFFIVMLGKYIHSGEVVVALQVASVVITMMFVDIRCISIKIFMRSIKFKPVLEKIILSVPLGVAGSLIAINTGMPRYVLGYVGSVSDIGVYSSIVYIIQIGGVFILSIGQVLSPRLSNSYHGDDFSKFRRTLFIGIMISALSGLVGLIISYLFGMEIIRAVYGSEFNVDNKIIVMMMAGGALSYIGYILGYAMTNTGIYVHQVYMFSIVCIIVLISSVVLIKMGDGLYNAAVVYIIMNALVVLLSISVLLWRRWAVFTRKH